MALQTGESEVYSMLKDQVSNILRNMAKQAREINARAMRIG